MVLLMSGWSASRRYVSYLLRTQDSIIQNIWGVVEVRVYDNQACARLCVLSCIG